MSPVYIYKLRRLEVAVVIYYLLQLYTYLNLGSLSVILVATNAQPRQSSTYETERLYSRFRSAA